MNSQKVPRAVIARSEATKQSPIISYLSRWGLLPPDHVQGRNDGLFDFLRNHHPLLYKIRLIFVYPKISGLRPVKEILIYAVISKGAGKKRSISSLTISITVVILIL